MARIMLFAIVLLPTTGGLTARAEHFFGKDSTWYAKIPSEPELVEHSDEYVREVYADSPLLTISYREWSVPIWYAKPGDTIQPLVRSVRQPQRLRKAIMDRAAKYQWNTNVPVPAEARAAAYGRPSRRTPYDNHMVIISPDRRYAWDFWRAQRQPDGSLVTHRIKRWDLHGDGIEQPYLGGGCRVAPVPLLHGLITYREIKNGRIDHALAFATHSAKPGSPGVFPCVSSNSGAGPDRWEPWLGFRFQLDPAIDVESLGLNRAGVIIARALQEYGMIFAENNGPGNNSIYAENLEQKTESWQGVLGNLKGIPLDRMRVVRPVYLKAKHGSERR